MSQKLISKMLSGKVVYSDRAIRCKGIKANASVIRNRTLGDICIFTVVVGKNTGNVNPFVYSFKKLVQRGQVHNLL